MVWVVAISLLWAGFAHRPALTVADLAQADYLASFGLTADDLCGVPGAEGGAMDPGDCPLCQLAGAMLLPDQAQGLNDLSLRHAPAVRVAAPPCAAGHRFNPAAPVRAPPLA